LYPEKCAECGGSVVVSGDDVFFEVRGESVRVPGIEHGLCEQCADEYFSLEATERLQREAIRLSKHARGLLSPEEIRAIRHALALSQVAFEDLLGVGPKTVVRWEKGTVYQSATADRLMRLTRAMPEVARALASGELYAAASCAPRLAQRHLAKR
jgi:HTH-type transcriptional regulator/antitoxin MqsA